ncbi:MAG: response regulator [Nitrospirales bacterium]|nr:response regulator [Nitrospira sp.]MDR4501060.1 response regulator [Nitrospirales bacterium]
MTKPTRLSRILIVEPDFGQQDKLMNELRNEGYEVMGVGTAREALDYVKRESFGLAIIELRLPDMNGIQLLEDLQNATRDIRVIIHTAYSSLDSAKDAVNLGAFAYIEKEQRQGELVRQVDRAMRSQLSQYARELEEAVAERTAILQEREERFRQLAEHIHEVFWLSSADKTQMYYVSPAYESIWGRSCASLCEDPASFLQAVHPDDQECLQLAIPKQIEGSYHETYRIIRPDGSVRWIESRAFPIKNEKGEVYRIAGIEEDITNRKRAEEALQKTEPTFRQSSKMEAIGTLAGGIAHDFNNILTAILGYTELALATVPKESRTNRNLQEVLTAGHRAKHLVQQILTFSRQSGQEQKSIDIHLVALEALKLLRATIPSTIEIRQNIFSQATIMADSTQIHQVIVNLCTNAEYAMRESGGLLDLTLEDMEVKEPMAERFDIKPGPYVRLTVKDSGPGMPPDVVERMFDPFFTTKPTGEGSGMGLAVVHGIVTTHGGTIQVESAPGIGTKIDIYLPTIHTAIWDVFSTKASIPNGKESILFVDDEETIVRLGQELLTHLGYTVTVRTNSVDALDLFRSDPQQFDLVITDQTMPTMPGDALARELLRIRPELPIILCTGFSHIVSAEKAKAIGIRGYLMKPLAIRDLAPIVRHVLDEQPFYTQQAEKVPTV